MGENPDAVYDEIVRRRQEMTRRFERMESRLRGDAEELRERAASHTPSWASEAASSAEDHPFAAMGVGLGSGVVLGMLGGSHASRTERSHHEEDEDKPTLLGFVLGGGIPRLLAGAAIDTVKPLVGDVFSGLKGEEPSPDQRGHAVRRDARQAPA
jgi:ElaB/YqjD/DUF883 family membrane-anchored ribosome-binding protein